MVVVGGAQTLGSRGILVSGSNSKHAGGLSAMPFRVETPEDLRMGDLLSASPSLNASPSTLVLTIDGLIVSAAQAQTRGKSDGRPCAASSSAHSYENVDWI